MGGPINGYCRNDHPQCQWPMEASERRGRRVRCNISCNMPSVFFFVVGCSNFASFFIFNLQPSNARRRQRTVRRQRTADRIVESCNVTAFFLCSLSLVFSHCESCFLRCATARATGVGDAHPMPLACRPGGAVFFLCRWFSLTASNLFFVFNLQRRATSLRMRHCQSHRRR